jgi:hypothetical protein
VTAGFDTLYFRYAQAGMSWYCMHIVEIIVIDETVLCTITAPAALTEDEMLDRNGFDLGYTLSNAGTVPVTVDRHELRIEALPPATEAGLETGDALQRAGGVLAAAADVSLDWRFEAQVLHNERTVRLSVSSYDEEDALLASCTHELHIPGIDGLRCLVTSADSVRFLRAALGYAPDPLPVTVELRNVLDSDETLIEAEIDLSAAPRFALADGESAQRTLPLIAAMTAEEFTWQLQPLAGPDDAQQQITVRYRSAEQSAWQECMTTVLIEAWPEERTLRCATGGHDTLWADAAYERMIPDELTISYAVTNTGTVPLTACAATIVLPPQFALLAGEEATKDYGDLAPGESRERWWHIEETAELSDFTAYDITWQWRSSEQGTTDGCTHVLHVVPHASTGLVLTPLRMHFEAERNEALPAAQELRLWTGGGLSMPWTAAGDAWWLAADPASGDRASVLAVRPVSTDLPVGLHATALRLAGQAPNLPLEIPVTYEITGIVSAGEIPAPGAFGLSAIWPQPVPMQGEARLALRVHPGEHVRLTLHDALGRQVAVLHDDVFADPMPVLRLRPSAHRLVPGLYLLRLVSAGGHAVRGVVVR